MSVREALSMRPREEHTILDPESSFLTKLERQFSEPDALQDPFRFEHLVRQGYRTNTIVRACVDEIATSISEPPMLVQRRRGTRWETFQPGGPGPSPAGAALLYKLLHDPVMNGRTTQYSFMEEMLTHYCIFGNALVRKRRRQGTGEVGALELLPVTRVEPKLNEKQVVVGVIVRKSSNRSLVPASQDSFEVTLQDLVHIKKPDPLDTFWGLPPMASALRAIDTDDKAQDYLRAFFKNGGTPLGLLSLKGRVRDEDRRSIRDRWAHSYSGLGGWHSVAVLDEDAKYDELGTRPDKLKLDHVFDKSESSICAAFQVPPVIIACRIGLNKSTYSNYSQARVSFWRETLRPLYVRVAQGLTMGIAREFGDDLRIAFDFDQVDDLQEPEKERRVWARQGYLDGVMTQNEARAVVDLPPVSGGDHFKTRTSDGKPQRPGELPDANGDSGGGGSPAAPAGQEDRVLGAPEIAEKPASPDPRLRVVA